MQPQMIPDNVVRNRPGADAANRQPTALTNALRLQSLDTLRGFDTFWISGGDTFVHVLANVTGWGWSIALAEQFTHVYYLIFPLFLFLAGVSTPFPLGSQLEKGRRPNQLIRKVVQRGIVLVLLGILYNNGLFKTDWATMRYPSVLHYKTRNRLPVGQVW